MLLTYLLLAASCHRGSPVLTFINLKKTYDWLPRVALWCMLAWELKVLEDIRTGIKALYYQTQSVVDMGGALSAAFDINSGVKQDYPTGPMCFISFSAEFEMSLILMSHPLAGCIPPYLIFLATLILLYANDVVLINASLERLQQLWHAFGCFPDVHGMQISQEKM